MDPQNNFPLRRLFRNEAVFVRDYRKRAYWIGVFQLAMSICFLLAVILFIKYMVIISSVVNQEYSNITEYQNEIPTSSAINSQDPTSDSAFSEVYFWMALNFIRAVLHILSSVLIMWATSKSIAVIQAIRVCYSTIMMNLAFLLYEIVVLVFMYQEWKIATFLVLYRLWFNHEIFGFLKQQQLLSPPPPGHGHHE